MNKLSVIKYGGAEVVDSREVAQMVDKPHNDMMKSIRSYCEHLTAGDFSLSDFFIPDTYKDSTGRVLPCYLLTKKGCDMVANKMTGEKGVLFTAAYVSAFEAMREHIQHGTPLDGPTRQSIAEAKLNNSRARLAAEWRKIAGIVSIPTYKDICASHASAALAGREVLPLPERTERYYTATEIGEMFGGISRAQIGKIANQNGLKTDQYGKMIWDKSPYSAKQVQSFVYNALAVEQFRAILGGGE